MPDGNIPERNQVVSYMEHSVTASLPDARETLIKLLENKRQQFFLDAMFRALKSDTHSIADPEQHVILDRWLLALRNFIQLTPDLIKDSRNPDFALEDLAKKVTHLCRPVIELYKGSAAQIDSRPYLNEQTKQLLEQRVAAYFQEKDIYSNSDTETNAAPDPNHLTHLLHYFDAVVATVRPAYRREIIVDQFEEPTVQPTKADEADDAAQRARIGIRQAAEATTRRRRIMACFALAAVAVVAVVGAVAAHYGADLASVQDSVVTLGEQLKGLGTSIAKIWSNASTEVTQQAGTVPPPSVLPTLDSMSDAVRAAASAPPVPDQAHTSGFYIGQAVLPESAARPFNLEPSANPFEISSHGLANAISQPTGGLDASAPVKPVASTGTGVGRRMTQAAARMAEYCRHLNTEAAARKVMDFANSVVARPAACLR